MSHPSLPPQIGKLLPLLASDKAGEVIATVRAIKRALAAAGCDLHDMSAAIVTGGEPTTIAQHPAPKPSFFDQARACRDLNGGRLNERERKFVSSMCALGNRMPSPRQERWLADIFARLQKRRTAA